MVDVDSTLIVGKPEVRVQIDRARAADLGVKVGDIAQALNVQRMVDEEAYCVDILTQIGSVVSASEKVATILLRDHVEHCVRESIEKIEELTAAVEWFLRV